MVTSLVLAMMLQAPKERFTYGEWRSSVVGGGGYLMNVVFAPSNPKIMYTYVDVGGMYRSDDGGKRWRMLHGGLPVVEGYGVRGLDVNPNDPNDVLVAHGDQWFKPSGIFRSKDGGKTWAQKATGHVFGNGEYRWSGTVLKRDPKDPKVIFLGTAGDQVLKSTDGGETWAKFGPENVLATDLTIDRTNSNRIWLCGGKVKTWVNGGEREFSDQFWRSEDGGKTWKKISDTSPRELYQHPKQPELLIGSFNEKEWKVSRDNGDTWADFGQGLPKTEKAWPEWWEAARLIAIGGGPDFYLAGGCDGSIYKRGLKDEAWTKVEWKQVNEICEGKPWYGRMQPGKYRHFASALCSIGVNPKDPNHWFFTDWYAIYQSWDAGKTWNLTNDGIETTCIHTFYQLAKDPGRLIMSMGDNSAFLSTDGGETFVQTSKNSNMKSLTASPKNPERIYGTGDKVGSGQWAAETVYVSANGGQSWEMCPMIGGPDTKKHRVNTVVADPRDPMRVLISAGGNVALGEGGVYESLDGGASWKWIGQGLPEGKEFFWTEIWQTSKEIAIDSNGRTLAVSRGMGKVYEYADGSWKEIHSGLQTSTGIKSDPFKPGHFMVTDVKGIHQTQDGGKSWKTVLAADTQDLQFDLAKEGRVAAGTFEGPRLSEDSGKTWKLLNVGLPFKSFNKIGFAGDRLLAGSTGSGVFWYPLNAEAAKTILAKPLPNPETPAFEVKNLLKNGNFTAGKDVPEDWGGTWTGSGKLAVSRIEKGGKSDGPFMRLASVGGSAYGITGQTLEVKSGPYRLTGLARSKGKFEEAFVALQGFDANNKQVMWQNAVVVGSSEWKAFDFQTTIPPEVIRVNVNVVLKGEGQIDVDDLVMSTPMSEATAAPASSTASATASNLLKNGSFEEGGKEPSDWANPWTGQGKTTLLRETDKPADGKAFARFTTNGAPGYGVIGQEIKNRPGTYKLTGKARMKGTLDEALVAIQGFDASGKQVMWNTAVNTNKADWSPFEMSVDIPASVDRFNVVIVVKGNGHIDVDNLVLTGPPAPGTAAQPVTAVEGDLLKNGDFEKGSTTPDDWGIGWTGNGKLNLTRQTSGAKTGTAYLRLDSNGADAYGIAGQNIKAVGRKYRLTGFARHEGSLAEGIVAIQTFNAEGKQIQWDTAINLPGKDWAAFNLEVNLPAEVSHFSVNVVLKGTGKVEVDSLKLVAIK